jgi:hypothetical protein
MLALVETATGTSLTGSFNFLAIRGLAFTKDWDWQITPAVKNASTKIKTTRRECMIDPPRNNNIGCFALEVQ